MSTKYGNGTIIHHNGIVNEPKYSHMGKLHKHFQNYAEVLVGQDVPTPIYLEYWNGKDWIQGTQQQAYGFRFFFFTPSFSISLMYISLPVYKNTTNTLVMISSSSSNFGIYTFFKRFSI